MKHGDVLVEGEFKPKGWGGVEEFEQLRNIEIIAGSNALEAFGDKEIGTEGVGDIEGEVPDDRDIQGAEVVQTAKVSNEDTVGLGIFDEAEKSSFARLLNSGGSEKDGNLGGFSESFDGRGKPAKILKVEIEEVGGFGCEGLGLFGSAAENGDNGLRGSRESRFLVMNGLEEGGKKRNGREGRCSYFLGNVGMLFLG
jgi:hypothetical protein